MRKSNVGMTMRKGFASAIQQLALRYNYNADIVAVTDTRKSNVGMAMRKGFASAIHIFCIYVGLIDDWVHRPSNRRAANVVAAHIYLYYDSKQAIFEIEQFCLINDWIHRPSNRRAANMVAAHTVSTFTTTVNMQFSK